MPKISEDVRIEDDRLHHSAERFRTGLMEVGELDLVSVGAFGRAVALQLRRLRSGLCKWIGPCGSNELSEIAAKAAARKGAVILAASHLAPAISESLARLAHENGRPFVAAVIDESVLRVGPVILPGVSGCWQCWIKRYQQHDTHPRETEALSKFYNDHPETGPRGYLQPFAWIAASQLIAIFDSKLALEHWAGKLWQLNLFSREVTTGELIGVDGCSRCGLNRPLRSRTSFEMQRSLAYLWNEDGKPGFEELADRLMKARSACNGQRE